MSSKNATSSNAHNQQKKEFQVRIPKTTNKRLTILKFNESLNVRPQRWTMETLRMEREDNRRAGVTNAGGFVQDFGEGSEYGKAAREEARLKRFGRQTRKYEHDKQPWRLTIEQQVAGDADNGSSKSTTKLRKFRSMREAGASEHADYWVFYKSGNDLEAHKVDEWYHFLPAVTYKYLDAEQAEERFKERDKVLNQFALKAQIQKQLAEQEDQLQQQQRQKIGDTLKRAGALKIKDEASSDDEGDDDEDDEQNDKSKNGSKKKKEGKKGKKTKNEKEEKNKTKKQRVKAADEIADYESEDGQDEGREYDYMSDSGSDSDREELNVDQKMDEDLVGVADEQGLKHDLDSDEEDDDIVDDEEDEDEQEKKDQEDGKKNGVKEQNTETTDSRSKAVKNVDKMMEQNSGAKIRAEFDAADESADSDSDEDPDSSRINSVLFMQANRKTVPSVSSSSQQRKRQEPGGSIETQPSSSISEQPESKRAKISGDEPEFEAISESFIRKLLERRPHSTKQLLTKVNQRFQQQQQNNKQNDNQTPPVKDKKIVAQLAEILKKIEPYQFRKKNEAGKDVLYFSMNRTA